MSRQDFPPLALLAQPAQRCYAIKLFRLGQAGLPWTVAENRWIVRETIAMFGDASCMFASNFPVDSLCADFATIFDGFREIVEDLLPETEARLFCGTAREVYGIE